MNNKTQRTKEFIRLTLEEETVKDLRGIPVKEAAVNFGLAILMVFATALHLGLTACQVGIAFLLLGYDLITKGLAKILPAPKSA